MPTVASTLLSILASDRIVTEADQLHNAKNRPVTAGDRAMTGEDPPLKCPGAVISRPGSAIGGRCFRDRTPGIRERRATIGVRISEIAASKSER
jgi:hypothetical protein